MFEKRMKEINARRVEIRAMLETEGEVDLDALTAELDGLEAEEAQLNTRREAAEKLNRGQSAGNAVQSAPNPITGGGGATVTEPEDKFATVEYRQAFMRHVMTGKPMPEEYRADAVSKTTDIGSVIPAPVLNKIIEKIEAVGMIIPLVTRTAYKGGLIIPTSTVKPVASWVAEGAGSDKQKKTTGSITFAYHKLRCAVAVTLEVETMALSAFENALISNVVEAMTMALEQSIISGTGTGRPKGILAETPAAGQVISSAAPAYADLVEAEAALPIEYESGAVWCMTKKTFMSYFGLVDEVGQPIGRVNYGIAGRPERSLLGRTVVICNYLDSYASSLAANKVFAFLFNFKDYVLNTNYEMGMKKYEDNDTDDLITRAVMLVDGKVVDVNSLVTIKKVSA